MRIAATLLVALVLGLVVAAAASTRVISYNCLDTNCGNCTKNKPSNATWHGDCSSLNGVSSKMFCSDDKVTLETFTNTDCNGTPASSSTYPENKCITYGSSSFYVFCVKRVPTDSPRSSKSSGGSPGVASSMLDLAKTEFP